MGKNSNGQLSILLTDELLKIAHFKNLSNSFEVANLYFQEIKGLSDDEVSAKIKEILQSCNLKNPEAICVLPSSVTTTKNIEIPSLDPKEIESIIELQAGRHTPYSREEISIGYINFGAYQKNYSKVLLVIVNRKIVMRQINILEGLGIRVTKILFGPEARAGFYAQTAELANKEAPIGIIDIDYFSTDFTIMIRDTVVACRNIPIGMSHLETNDTLVEDRFVAELKQSVESYQSEDIEKLPSEYILSNTCEDRDQLQTVLSKSLNITVKADRYFDKVKLNHAAKHIVTSRLNVTFLDVIAPLFVTKQAQINFLPEEIQVQRSLEEQSQEGIKLGILVLILLVIVGVMVIGKMSFKSTLLDRIKKEYDQTQKDARHLEEISTKTRLMKAYLTSRLMPLEALRELYEIIPEDVYLNSFLLDENGKIMIDGTSDSMSQVFALVGSLENSKFFKSVKTKSTTAKKERGKDVAAFELTFKLESADDDEEEVVVPAKGADKKAPEEGSEKKEEPSTAEAETKEAK